jgi:hypothetical protein
MGLHIGTAITGTVTISNGETFDPVALENSYLSLTTVS